MDVIVWLVRHGETDWNRERRLQGWSDVPLNRTGHEQASELGVRLGEHRFESVSSSDLSRAAETAIGAGLEPRLDAAWRELDFGLLEGLRWDELDEATQARLAAFDSFEAPGGESVANLRVRVVAALDGLSPGSHAVFTHGGVIRLVQRLCGGEGFPGHTQVIRVDWTHRRLRDGPEG